MLGASYLDTKLATSNLNINTEESSLTAVRPASSRLAPRQSKTLGVFGSLTYDITDAFIISLEGRYQEDKVFAKAGGAGTVINPGNAFGFTPGTFTLGQTFFTKSYKNFLPRAIISYDVTPDVMIYASYSQGVSAAIDAFNANLLNITPAQVAAAQALGVTVVQNPERLKNYEIGLKGSFFDRRVRIAIAGYVADWTEQFNTRQTAVT